MSTTIALSTQQLQDVRIANEQSGLAIGNAARANTITGDGFVFFATFDGTNNDHDNYAAPGDTSTHVSALFQQTADAASFKTGNYPGPASLCSAAQRGESRRWWDGGGQLPLARDRHLDGRHPA
jgi:hypothetical protein